MTYTYIATMKVPNWLVVGNISKAKREKVINFFIENGAHQVEIDVDGFVDHIKSYRGRGYFNVFNEKDITIPYELLDRSFYDYMVKLYGNVSLFPVQSHIIKRGIKSDNDYKRLFGQMLAMQPDIALSRTFQIGELCHDQHRPKRPQWFVSDDLGDIPNRLSDRCISIGGSEDDIDISDIKGKDFEIKLEERIIEFINNSDNKQTSEK